MVQLYGGSSSCEGRCRTFKLVWEEVKSFTISDILSESREVLTDILSHSGACERAF